MLPYSFEPLKHNRDRVRPRKIVELEKWNQYSESLIHEHQTSSLQQNSKFTVLK